MAIFRVTSLRAAVLALACLAGQGAQAQLFGDDQARQAILDSWPRALDDRNAQQDWGWKPTFDLAAMTADLVPRVRELLARTPDALSGH